ncbi:MMS19 nucleotide excision repair protein homolog [Argopecten irradians]|uniref:MMS19 nucleotide excision repair protein homolog n=1 Tax=Argopecten irradians TaxID=31199 RepID=UPI0037182867
MLQSREILKVTFDPLKFSLYGRQAEEEGERNRAAIVTFCLRGLVLKLEPYPAFANLITDDSLSLLELVEGLGVYLTSEETFERGRVVKLLADILYLLPTDKLTAKEIELLVAYLCDRLKDHHSIQPPTLAGLLALCHAKHLPEGCPEKMCQSIFSEVQTQTLAQGDRQHVYNIFSVLLSTHLQELQKMGSDFVLGYIRAMDAEKDPRNLVLAFRCANIVIVSFPLGVFVEEMFEVVSCYFPVDFTPPPGDPHGITKDDLILGLRGCLAATPQFGQFCCPLLLEKISSDVTSAKIDSFRTLEAAAKVYGSKCLLEYKTSLFNCIKREVFGSGNSELETAALSALTAVSTTFSQDTIITDSQTCVEEFVSEVWDECSRYLGDDNLRLMASTCRLLCAVAAGSEVACSKVLSLVIPRLVQIFYSHPQAFERNTVLKSIQTFLQVTRQFNIDTVKKLLAEFQTALYAVIMCALSESSVQLSATQCLDSFLQLPLTLEESDRQLLAKVLVDKIFKEEDKEVRSSYVTVLSTLAKTDVLTTKSVILPGLLEKLKPTETEVTCALQHERVFTALAAISVSLDILSMVVKELVNYLSALSRKSTNEADIKCVAGCLSDIFTAAVSCPDLLTFLYSQTLPELFSLLISMATDPSHHNSCVHNEAVLLFLAACVYQVVLYLDKKKLTELYKNLTQVYLRNATEYLTCTMSTQFQPLQISSPWQQTQLMTLVTPVICSCPMETSLDKALTGLYQKTAGPSGFYTSESLSQFLQTTCDKIYKILEDAEDSTKTALNLLIWITKALAMRGHSKAKELMNKLSSLLEDTSLGEQAATGFAIILGDFPDIFSKANGSHIQMMYKQRVFVENLRKLQEGFQGSSPGTKKNYLICLSHMLNALPRQVFLSELPPLFPLLVHSLQSDDLDLQLSTTTILCDLTHDAPDLISKHVDTLLPHLLQLCTQPSSMKIRIEALRLVSALSALPDHLLLRHKAKVVRRLEKVLDDKKRLVRKEAVTARSQWFLIGEPS